MPARAAETGTADELAPFLGADRRRQLTVVEVPVTPAHRLDVPHHLGHVMDVDRAVVAVGDHRFRDRVRVGGHGEVSHHDFLSGFG